MTAPPDDHHGLDGPPSVDDPTPPDVVADITRRLVARFGARVPEEVVTSVVRRAYDSIAAGARVTAFLPILTERAANAQLAALANREREQGRDGSTAGSAATAG